jgi:hypothetical protein
MRGFSFPVCDMFKPCLRCGHTMKGIRDHEAREKCDDCGGAALFNHETPQRVAARQHLAELYAAKKPPLQLFR